MKTYIEIIRYENEECVKRLDVSGKTQRSIDAIESGMNINLNHEEYFTRETSSEKSLSII